MPAFVYHNTVDVKENKNACYLLLYRAEKIVYGSSGMLRIGLIKNLFPTNNK